VPDGTQHTLLEVANIGGAVDGDGTGGRFGNDDQFHHLLPGYPFFLLHTGIFNDGDHGISAAEGKQTDLKKGPEQFQQIVPLFLKIFPIIS